MKIAVLGFSGSGKSTLCRKLGEKYGLPVLHLDRIHWMPGWQARPEEEKQEMLTAFLDENASWVIDGNYSRLLLDRRTAEADRIYILALPRFVCLFRVLRRYFAYRGKTRQSLGEGCPEKIDLPFISWVLFGGRTRRHHARFREIAATSPEKTVYVRSRRQLAALTRAEGLSEGVLVEPTTV